MFDFLALVNFAYVSMAKLHSALIKNPYNFDHKSTVFCGLDTNAGSLFDLGLVVFGVIMSSDLSRHDWSCTTTQVNWLDIL